MSVRQLPQTAYGKSQALIGIAQDPIISDRDPTTSDKAQLATIWVNKVSSAAFILASIISNVATWVTVAGGPGFFTSITVTPGNITITNGDLIVTLGDITAGGSISAGGAITTTSGNVGTDNGNLLAANTTATANGPALLFGKSRNGAIVQVGDSLGQVTSSGFDGATFINSSAITTTVTGTPGVNRVASTLGFWTHPDSTGAISQKMTINSAGVVTVLNPDAQAVSLQTSSGDIVSGNGITATLGNITATNGNFICSTAGTFIRVGGGAQLLSGAGDPNGIVSATQGSLYMNTTGATTTTRLWINTNGLTAWTAFTSLA